MSRSRCLSGTLLLTAGLLVSAGCSDSTIGSPSVSGGAATSPGLSIPAGELPPDIQCLVDHGFTLIKITDPYTEGERPGYQLMSDLPSDQVHEISKECQKLAPPDVQKTDEELRVIFDRWVDERNCLIGLGYQPAPPPSFEKFVADWRSTGPWMPINGIDTPSWTDTQYREAKERCRLEFYTRD
jgi:hypothetical protein